MKCYGNPGGDCLSSCTTIHLSNTNDRLERRRVNRKINNHIADHYDEFYVNKISLPYSETVGVGSNAKQVTCSTREELLAFLRSEDSLCTFSNYQELLAICNLINIKIHIFTYCIGGDNQKWSWSTVFPDPNMTKYSEFMPGTVPDMLLYNCDNVHYDLLVEDNSRLAVLGLISMEEGKELDKKEVEVNEAEVETEVKNKKQSEEQWKTVNYKKANKSVISVENSQASQASEEEIMSKHKLNGHKRVNPQSAPCAKKQDDLTVNIEAQLGTLTVSEISCDTCHEEFVNRVDFEQHKKINHSLQWNCEDCDFQASTRLILMNHCEKTPGHQPVKHKQRLGQTGVLLCYTCKAEFRIYHDLMSHRKAEHPSHKKCRYFLKGECNFSAEECWYLHEGKNNSLESESHGDDNCYVCKTNFATKHDLMDHKKKNHPSRVPCWKFLKGICDRSAEECWFKHSSKAMTENNTNKNPSAWDKPLQNMWQKDFQKPRNTAAPDQGPLMMALKEVTKRLQEIESQMNQRLN